MQYQKLELKDYFPFLGENQANPTLEVYLPYNMAEMHREHRQRPCVLVCPGGAYCFCSEREAEPIALQFLPQGYNVFVLNYSVAPFRFPTQIREVAAAMELIYAQSASWNCDTDRIAIIGFSAGGHLAAHYSTMYDCREVRQVFPASKPVNATILSYPVITADFSFTHQPSILNLVGHKPASPEEQAYFSCECQVSRHTPPTFIWHTAADSVVPVQNSLAYAAALAEHHVPVELHIFPHGGHGLSTCDAETLDCTDDIANHNHVWLDCLKNWLAYTFPQ